MADDFTFDEKTHTYRLRGRVLLSVTDVLVDQGFVNPQFYTEESRVRGTRVHLLCEFYDQGDYNPAEARRFGLEGYVTSWARLRDKLGIKIKMIEKRMYHPRQLVAGTLDRVVEFTDGHDELWDIKSGEDDKSHPYQTGGYDELLTANGFTKPRRRAGIYLKADGSYPFVDPHNDPFDGPNFLALAQASNLRRHHGIGNARR